MKINDGIFRSLKLVSQESSSGRASKFLGGLYTLMRRIFWMLLMLMSMSTAEKMREPPGRGWIRSELYFLLIKKQQRCLF
jgi:hypothetical protein